MQRGWSKLAHLLAYASPFASLLDNRMTVLVSSKTRQEYHSSFSGLLLFFFFARKVEYARIFS